MLIKLILLKLSFKMFDATNAYLTLLKVQITNIIQCQKGHTFIEKKGTISCF